MNRERLNWLKGINCTWVDRKAIIVYNDEIDTKMNVSDSVKLNNQGIINRTDDKVLALKSVILLNHITTVRLASCEFFLVTVPQL